MNDTETLFRYRLEQARSTLDEAERMLATGFSARSIVNRAYYAMFYMVLALFLKKGIQIATSKHSGVMTIFDKEFVLSGLVDRCQSKFFHKMFDRRLEFDYKDYSTPLVTDAKEAVEIAKSFVAALEKLVT